MKSIAHPSFISPSIVVLLLISAAVVLIGIFGKKVPLFSNPKVDIIALMVIGTMICTLGGIGRVAAANAWGHPLAIIGYILGGSIILITMGVFLGWKLPLLQTEQQAMIAIAILMGLKIVVAATHTQVAGI